MPTRKTKHESEQTETYETEPTATTEMAAEVSPTSATDLPESDTNESVSAERNGNGNEAHGVRIPTFISTFVDEPERLLRAKLHAKKIRASAAIGRILKTGEVDFTNNAGKRTQYEYVTEMDVLVPIIRECNRYGLDLTFDTLESEVSTNEATGIVKAILTDIETGYQISNRSCKCLARVDKKPEASSRVASSKAKQNAALLMFGLPCADSEEQEAEAEEGKPIQPTYVSKEQANALVEIVRSANVPIELVKGWLGYDSPGLVPIDKFEFVKANLVTKIAEWKAVNAPTQANVNA